jgi:hypothetical protein
MASDILGNPISQGQTTENTLSSWAAPYFTNSKNTGILDRSSALSQQQYQPYTGQRVADFSGLQNQAFQGIGSLQGYSPIKYQTQSFNAPGVAQSFISPYSSAVTDIAAREAQRKFDTQQTQLGQAGASTGFGDRFRLVQAENERNNAQQQNDIRTQGLQSAYTAGQNQFNTENQNNLYTQLAQNQANYQGYQSGIGALDKMFDYGGAQQANAQKGLDVGYENYQTAQKFPYTNLTFQRDMLSGLPVTSQNLNTTYAPPNPWSQAVGAGVTGYGILDSLSPSQRKLT